LVHPQRPKEFAAWAGVRARPPCSERGTRLAPGNGLTALDPATENFSPWAAVKIGGPFLVDQAEIEGAEAAYKLAIASPTGVRPWGALAMASIDRKSWAAGTMPPKVTAAMATDTRRDAVGGAQVGGVLEVGDTAPAVRL